MPMYTYHRNIVLRTCETPRVSEEPMERVPNNLIRKDPYLPMTWVLNMGHIFRPVSKVDAQPQKYQLSNDICFMNIQGKYHVFLTC